MLKLSLPVSCQTITQKYDILHIFDTCTTVFNKTLNFKRNEFLYDKWIICFIYEKTGNIVAQFML